MVDGSLPRVRIEFYGLARLRAGRMGFEVVAATVGEALGAADTACPGLSCVRNGRLATEYLLSTGAGQFTPDLTTLLVEGDTVLVFGADAGG
jgi:molybdopterin converting factor small subunit